MGYRHYTLTLALCVAAVVLLTVATTACLLHGAYVLSFLFVVVLACVGGCLWSLILHPQKQVELFLLAMRCEDRMIRFPRTKDRVLNSMYSRMNDIVKMYIENKNEVETKKRYYDRILRIMTHEIRNTVTPIVSLSEFYLQGDSDFSAADIREGMQIINSQSNNLREFLNSYHMLTHLPEPELSELSTASLFNEIYGLLRKEPCGDRINVQITNVSIMADRVQMQLILSNLLRNAMYAIREFDDGRIELCASMSGKCPFITVADNGCGIPPERIENIFLPFYTTKHDGSGIGLCLSRQIMRLHGGDLTVESHPSKRFTVFTLTFPEQL